MKLPCILRASFFSLTLFVSLQSFLFLLPETEEMAKAAKLDANWLLWNRADPSAALAVSAPALNVNRFLLDCPSVAAQVPKKSFRVAKVSKTLSPPFDMAVHKIRRDMLVSRQILKHGCFECILLNGTLRALQNTPDAFLLDFGSNIGIFSLAAAAMGRQSYAFEPFKMNYQRICQSVTYDPAFAARVQVFRAALSDEQYRIDFGFLNQQNPSAVHIQRKEISIGGRSSDNHDDDEPQEEGVDYAWAVPLDALQSALPRDRPAVLKIDVEGHECSTLRGGMQYLRQLDIVYATMEVSHQDLLKCPDILELFVKNGLVPYRQVQHDLKVWVELDPANLTEWTDDKASQSYFNVEWTKSVPEGNVTTRRDQLGRKRK